MDCHTFSCSAQIEPSNLHPAPGRLSESIELACEVTSIYCPCLKASPGWACDVLCALSPEACRGWPKYSRGLSWQQPLWPINRLGGQETGNPDNTMKPEAQGFPPGWRAGPRMLLGPKALLNQDSLTAGPRCLALPTVLRGLRA